MLIFLFGSFNSTSLTTRAIAKSPHHVASSGDWPTYLVDNSRSGFNGAETIINPGTAPNLRLHWSYSAAGAISAQPVEANGMIYWGSWDGYEHATDLNGKQIWATNLGQTSDSSCKPPVVGIASTATVASIMLGGKLTPVVFVGGGNGQFYALNASDGTVVWHTLLGKPPAHFIWSSPAIDNGLVYIGLSSFGDCPLVQGKLIQMNATNGRIQHKFDVVPNGCVGGGVWSSPTIDNSEDAVYFTTGTINTCSSGEPYAIALVKLKASDLSFLSAWQIPPSQRVGDGDFGATATLFQATIGGIMHNMIAAANKNGIYYAFDRDAISNGPLWTAEVADKVHGCGPVCGGGSISPSAWDGTTLYVAGEGITIHGTHCGGSVGALDPATGAYLWQDCLSGHVLGAVTAVPGVVAVGAGSSLILLAASSGQTLFTYHTNAKIYGPASISNGVLYIGDISGNLYAFGT